MRPFATPSFFRRIALGLGFGAALALSGCSAKNPTLQVQGAQITGATVQIPPFAVGLRMDVGLAANNPNSFDLQVRNVRGQVSMMNGRYALPLNISPNVWLPSDRTTSFTVPVTVPVDTGLALLRDSLGMGCIPYVIQGVADITATSTFKIDKNNYELYQNGCMPRQTLLNAVRPYNPTAL